MESEVDYDDDNTYDLDHDFIDASIPVHGRQVQTDELLEATRQMKADLRFTKQAGFRVSCFGNIISVSCRVKRLGISEEAMRAWKLHADNYLILLVR